MINFPHHLYVMRQFVKIDLSFEHPLKAQFPNLVVPKAVTLYIDYKNIYAGICKFKIRSIFSI